LIAGLGVSDNPHKIGPAGQGAWIADAFIERASQAAE
jgi:hypothetical protein